MSEKFNRQAYKDAYGKTHYDSVAVRLPKGSRDALKAAAAERGYSLAGYITYLAARDGVELPQRTSGGGE